MNGDELLIRNMRTPREMVLAYFEVLATTQPLESDYTVGTAAVLLGQPGITRLRWTVSNTGSVNVALGFRQGITIATGNLLLPGGFAKSWWFEDLEEVGYQVWAIGASSGATLHMIESQISGA